MEDKSLFQYSAQVDVAANGVIIAVDLINGGIKGSTVGETILYLNILVTTATNLDKVKITACKDTASAVGGAALRMLTAQDCTQATHYTEIVGETAMTGNYSAITMNLKITTKDANFASVSLNGGSVNFYFINFLNHRKLILIFNF